MSKISTPRDSMALPRAACWAVIGLGTLAAIWNAGVDADSQITLAKTFQGAVGMAGASIIYQMMVLAFAGIAGHLLFRARAYKTGALACLVMVFFLAYNMLGVMSFQAREIIIPGKISEEHQQAKIDASLEAKNTQNQRQSQAIQTLREDALAAAARLRGAKGKTERASAQEAKRAADNAYVEASFATVTTQALPTRDVSNDYRAEFVVMILSFFGKTATIGQVQTAISAWWGAGLNLAKVLCWFFGFGLMRKPEEKAEATLPEAAEVLTPEAILPAKPFKLHVHSNENVRTTAAPKSVDQVRQFISEATRPAPGARITATTMHQHFIKWAELRGYPRLNANTFGRNMTALGVQRQLEAHANTYLGVGLARLGEEGRLLNVA